MEPFINILNIDNLDSLFGRGKQNILGIHHSMAASMLGGGLIAPSTNLILTYNHRPDPILDCEDKVCLSNAVRRIGSA